VLWPTTTSYGVFQVMPKSPFHRFRYLHRLHHHLHFLTTYLPWELFVVTDHKQPSSSERAGAASGLLASVLLVIAAIVLLATARGDPSLPDVSSARFAPAYFAENLNSIRLLALLTAVGIALFLWFLATLRTALREAEGSPGRGSTATLIGGVAGSALILVALALTATAGLSTSVGQADSVPMLYVASSILTTLGGGILALFFFGAAKVILQSGVIGRWLGWLAIVVGLLALCGFMTPFFTEGILNAATGGLGRWAWSAAFVVWLFLASGVMTLARRRRSSEADPGVAAEGPPPRSPVAEGAS
jgi:hypothetical protein